jgi:hypothetical protein
MYVFGSSRRILGYSYGSRNQGRVIYPETTVLLWFITRHIRDSDCGERCSVVLIRTVGPVGVRVLGFVGCEAYFKSCYSVGVVFGTV